MDVSLKNNNLTKGKIWKVMLKFVLPIFLGTLFQSLYNTIDAIIVGKFAGKEAVAAIESVLNFQRLPITFFVGLSSGATIIISQYFGANKKEDVSKASHTAILFAMLGGLLLSILSCVFSPFFIKLIKVPEEIFYQAQIYTIICFIGIVASMTYNIGSGILRALGDSKTPFYILIVSNILNIVLDLILVIVFNLGVIGVGMATLISEIVSAILIFIMLIKTNLDCKIYINKLYFYKKYIKEIFRLGLPIGIQSVLYPISNTIIQSSINTFGVNSIAAWAISGKLDFLIWTVSDAFSIAVSTFVAQNYGAKKHQRARDGIKVALSMSMVAIFIISFTLYFYNKPLAYFLIDDKEVVDLTSEVIHLIAPLYFIYVIGDVLSGSIRGTGNTLHPMVINIFGICICRILWVFLIVPLNPTFFMVLYGFIVSWIITALMYIVYVIYKRKSF
ncbi:MATE family efflux transporter [Fusobacterium nucleatum subsp. nucleatum ATCC 23726]|uniref:MATE efflux family protein n=1 Tax=Fusobacterium nucleatum subsp. nucleatum (strain ATCC 23726 / VPI 4351) TaxID=525283 RepID=D5RFD7_FUSN2|nr:MATE family efflux transporter [Fusobacterium nucleatum]AVQ22355.1 MATE family efflux transporter [Fusobacterium nucleatum subsp. nucleatum ATCC 23726]EFG94401.1 MATE efflux family protein [Fusobacterium nucleatum subsp. nucleatum ATCC 23726]